jgi:hypothetical protein
LACLPQGVQPWFLSAVAQVFDDKKWVVEEDTFGLRLTDVMFIGTLTAIAVVPIKAGDPFEIDFHVYIHYIQI